MNANGLVSGERCNCEGQLLAEELAAAYKEENGALRRNYLKDTKSLAEAADKAEAELARLRSEMAGLIQEMDGVMLVWGIEPAQRGFSQAQINLVNSLLEMVQPWRNRLAALLEVK